MAKNKTPPSDPNDIVQITLGYINEARMAKLDRMEKNKLNFDVYHMRQDYSHKLPGQSREFLLKQGMAVEQITSLVQQSLIDSGEWFGMETQPGVIPFGTTDSQGNDDPNACPISADEAKAILASDLEKCNYIATVADSVKLGLLQSLMILKPRGEMKNRSVFYSESKEVADGTYKNVLKRADKKYWSPVMDVLRAEDWFPDPRGSNLYKIQQLEMDFHTLKQMSVGDDAIYDSEAVDSLGAGFTADALSDAKKARETDQNTSYSYGRKIIKLYECWGTIVSATGEVLHEDVTWTIADDRTVVRKPTPFPFWHGQMPYITAPFIRVPHSEWHKALMDGPTRANIALNELYNLMVDEGMNSAYGIKMIRTDWLEDESQVSNGVIPGITLKVNSQAPVGAKVIETVPMNGMSGETMQVYQMMNSEFSAQALTNDLRMGVMPSRAVKATEVVEASQSITGVMTGISKVIENNFIEPSLYQTWANRLQHMDKTYLPDLIALVGQDRAQAIMSMSKEDLFAKCVDGFKFKVFGISRLLSKQKDYKKLMALLQTIAGDPPLMEEFQKTYSLGKFLSEIIESLDISKDKIKLTAQEIAQQQAEQAQAAEQQQVQGQGQPQPGAGPDQQSQIPQAASGQGGGEPSTTQGVIAQFKAQNKGQ